MKARALVECTIDLSQPATEIIAVINAVLAALPEDKRVPVLEAVDIEIGTALALKQ